jgi:peptide/nickel transport system substrate-binding protein
MSMAINQDDLIAHARFGQATPLCTDHGSGYHPGYDPTATCPKYDIAGANALLDSDGWVKGSDGVRAKGGQRLEFRYSTTAKNPWRAADERILLAAFQSIGIKIDIQNYPADTFFGTILPQSKYDLAEFENSFNLGYDPDDSSEFACSQIPTAAKSFAGGNTSFYCNHALDPLYTTEQGTTDANIRQMAFHQIHQIYLQDVVFVTLYGAIDLSVYKKTGHNYVPAATETVNVWTWWCDNGKC